ncbi:nitroreductase family protein [Actinoplanes sp. KI2]|uniref:nitroreductase family protein n=1 Tax=Actinoplanes sp. KI2 TaxID=2983315 RepID=UPI0021D5B2AB|nr:nitroreductase family protein [Actinoplanes sp. KI2]MCU7727310.1 nitroreductase family protein [Actinoplanes sp. KI2]
MRSTIEILPAPPAGADPGRDRLSLLGQLLADTQAGGRPVAPVPPHLLRAPDGGPPIALPRPAPPRASLDDVLPGRTAVRDFAGTPVAAAELSALLAAADRMDAEAFPAERDAGLGLELYCAAARVTGLDAGLYRHVPERPALRPVASLPDGLDELVTQPGIAGAPALLIIMGNLAGALARHGSHGHRLLLSRAGAAGQAAWLTALRLHLTGTLYAGLQPHVLRERAGADGYHRAALLAFAAGHPQHG